MSAAAGCITPLWEDWVDFVSIFVFQGKNGVGQGAEVASHLTTGVGLIFLVVGFCTLCCDDGRVV